MVTKSTKDHLASLCLIAEWDPSEEQIREISSEIKREIRSGKQLRVADCQALVSRFCPDALFVGLEGLDNSDLNTLLLLATKAQ